MDASLSRKLTALEMAQVKEYLKAALQHPNYGGNFPLRDFAVYVENKAWIIYLGNSTWQFSAPYLYVGTRSLGAFPKVQALSVLLALCQIFVDDVQVNEWASNALSKYLIDEFNQLRQGLVVANTPATGIAFTKDNQVAALLGDEWYLNNGEVVDVTGDQWTRCTL